MAKNTKEHTYCVEGMRCASCEILIEKKLLGTSGVKSAEASLGGKKAVIYYAGRRPKNQELNRAFEKEGYSFSSSPPQETKEKGGGNLFYILWASALVIIVFLGLNRLGLEKLVNIGSASSLPTFFFLGVLAGLSSCAALVGGLILSLSKQWGAIYSSKRTFLGRASPHLMFNVGRVLSFGALGYLLGLIGGKIQLSAQFTALLIFAISFIMVLLALQMLGVNYFQRFRFGLPKSATGYVADEKNFKGKYMPLLLGGLTFFLPCGFTLTAQGMALISGSPSQASLIMTLFALGTAPSLLAIGFSSAKLFEKPHLSRSFSKIAGVLILFFAVYNINSQINVLGFAGLNTIAISKSAGGEEDLPAIVDGKQVIQMDALPFKYKPSYFKVRAGVPVRWEITDQGTSGCTNAIISKGLFEGEIPLTTGEVSVKEFTVEKPGKYVFSCWMGMISGIIEAVG